jgi:hypothetical protein
MKVSLNTDKNITKYHYPERRKNDTIEEKTVITIPTFPSDKAAVKNIVKTVPQFNREMEETGGGGLIPLSYIYMTVPYSDLLQTRK